jgi:hypothetical protein
MWSNDKPKSKYALVISADINYLVGVNATINALDYYGNQIDLHFIHDDLPDNYWDSLKKSDLNYRIVLHPHKEIVKKFLEEYPNSFQNRFQQWTYIKYWYMANLREDYDVVSCWDGDEILLNNITPWYDLVCGTRYMMAAYHAFHNWDHENYDERCFPSDTQPLWNAPLICDPKKWYLLFLTMLKMEETTRWPDMLSFNRCMLALDKMKDVFLLDDCEWGTQYIYFGMLYERRIGGKDMLVGGPTYFRVNTIHGKWCNKGFTQTLINKTDPVTAGKIINNVALIEKMHKKMNTTHKVNFYD